MENKENKCGKIVDERIQSTKIVDELTLLSDDELDVATGGRFVSTSVDFKEDIVPNSEM